MSYGSRALQALGSFYSGEYFSLDGSYSTLFLDLLTETPSARALNAMPPLLQRLTERKPKTA